MTNFIHWTPCPALLTLPTVGCVTCGGSRNLNTYGDIQLTTVIDNEEYECDMCGACCRSLILEGVYELDIQLKQVPLSIDAGQFLSTGHLWRLALAVPSIQGYLK